jgi:MFS family permease
MYKSLCNRDFSLLTLSNFLLCITYYSLISTLPIYLADRLHADKSAIGLVLAAYTIASVTVRPISGFALDKFGRKMILIGALILYSVIFIGYVFALSITLITVLRFIQGLGWGISTISGSTVAVDIIPSEKRGEGIGYYSLSTTLGMSVGPVIGLFLVHHGSYFAMFSGMLVFSIIAIVCAGIVKVPTHIPLAANAGFNMQSFFEPKAVMPSINLMVVMTAYGGLLSFIALYGQEMGVHDTSLFFLVFAFGIAISRIAVGRTFDKKGPALILTVCLLLDIIGFTVLALLKNPVGYFASAILIGFGNGVVFPVFQTMVNNLAEPAHRGAANSTLYTALDLGMGAGMILIGFISEHTSLSAAFICCAAICILGLTLFRFRVLNDYLQKTDS